MADNAADPGFAAGDGESFDDLLRRVERTRERLVADDVDRTLLVGHGIFCRFMFALTLFGDEFGPRHAAWLWRIGSLNCGLSTFDHVVGGGSDDPADISGWRCVTWMAPTVGRGAGDRDRRRRPRRLTMLLEVASEIAYSDRPVASRASFVLAYICIRSCCPSRIVQTWAKCISTETPLAFERPCWRTMTTTLSPAST